MPAVEIWGAATPADVENEVGLTSWWADEKANAIMHCAQQTDVETVVFFDDTSANVKAVAKVSPPAGVKVLAFHVNKSNPRHPNDLLSCGCTSNTSLYTGI